MIGLDIVFLIVFGMRFVSLFTSKSSLYLYSSDQTSLAITLIPLLIIIVYIALSIRRTQTVIHRTALAAFLVVLLVATLIGMQFSARLQSQPYLYIHDGAVQTEDAVAALKMGENPYAISYVDRTFGAFPDLLSEATQPNPAWIHYVYLPLPFIFGLPLSIAAEQAFGWFDIRMLYLMSFAVLVLSAVLLAKTAERRILVLILVAFNPLFAPYMISGFNDVFFLGWIALGALLLQRKRWLIAAALFGAAFASKQSAWFVIPFYVAHVAASSGYDWRTVWKRVWPAVVVPAIVVLPFILWSSADFIADIWHYPAGSAEQSYPVSGFGLSQLLLRAGVIQSMWDYYPFWIFQALLGLPLLWWLLRWQRRQPNVERLMVGYGLLSFVLWFISRFFNDNYIGVVSVIFLLAFAARQSPDEARL